MALTSAFLNDLRFAFRTLARNPGFAAAAILSLGLGIGANSAVFTLADQVMLRLLPVKEPRQLVEFKRLGTFIGGRSMCTHEEEPFTFAYPAYLDLRNGNPGALTGIAARRQESVDIGVHGSADRAVAELVSGNYFEVLGVGAALGRTLTPDDDKVKNGEPYLVLSYSYWQRRFGSDPAVLNSTVDLNGRPMTVVGVARRDFHGFEKVRPSDVFVPMMMKPLVTPTWDDMARRNSIWLNIFGRLRSGVSAHAAETALAGAFETAQRNDLAQNSRGDWAKKYLAEKLQLVDAAHGLLGARESFSRPLVTMAAMVGILLLIACVNVANLLLTRSAARQKEIAIRLSLGASRWRLVRLVMTESLLISLAGGVLALLCSVWTSSSLLNLVPGRGLDVALTTAPDARILAFTALVSFAAALLFGLVPALQASRPDLIPALKIESGRASLPGGHRRLSRLLVAGQVTLSLSLLVTAGLFARSLYRLLTVETGVSSQGLLQFSIAPSRHNYNRETGARLFARLQHDLERLPGARLVSASEFTLLSGRGDDNTVTVEGYKPAPDEDMNPRCNLVLPGYFSTLGVPLVAGRDFTEADRRSSPMVAIVNETFVQRFFKDRNPIGRHIGWGGEGSPYETVIVGVVRDFRGEDPKQAPRPLTVLPALQGFGDWAPPEMTFYVRTAASPVSLVSAAHTVLRDIDPSIPMYDVRTVEDQIGETNAADRLLAVLACAFALLATLLAAVGLYGVTAYAVARRTPELGIRIALGAGRGLIVRLVLREVLWLTAAGIAVGVPVALALGRLAESRLYEMKGNDPVVLAAAVLVIAAISSLAGYLPARRAARIDPLEALRQQ